MTTFVPIGRMLTLMLAMMLALSSIAVVSAQQGEDVRLRDLTNNPEDFVGETVTVTGPVGDELDREAFTLTRNGQEFLVVGDRQAIPSNLAENVEVTGDVRESFNIGDIEDELGVRLNDQALQEFEDEPFLLAEDVQNVRQGQAQQNQQGRQDQQAEVRLQREVERFCQRFEEDFAGMTGDSQLFQDVDQFCQQFQDERGAAQGQVTQIGDITDQPQQFIGETVRARGDVGETIGDQGFLLQDNGEILTLTPEGVSPDELGNGPVEATGPVEEFNREEVEQDLGITLDEQEFAEFEGEPFIQANTIATDEDDDGIFGEEEDDQVFGEDEDDGGLFDFFGDDDEDEQ